MVIFHSYVSLPEGSYYSIVQRLEKFCPFDRFCMFLDALDHCAQGFTVNQDESRGHHS